jgi:delta 1-pyrroline-5-carboxylate dehydrogenase
MQDENYIHVPFLAKRAIYVAFEKGVPLDVIAIIAGCEESVIKKIIEREKFSIENEDRKRQGETA